MDTDYFITFLSFSSILFAELYLHVMNMVNRTQTLWKLEILRIGLGFVFIIFIIASCVYIGSITEISYGFTSLKVGNFIPLFNFSTYLVTQWKRSLKILGPQRNHKVDP